MTSSPDNPPAPLRRLWPLAVGLCAVGAYLGKLTNGFLLWDDKRFIHRHELIHDFANLPQFFASGIDGLYRPLRTTLYALSYDVLGFGEYALPYQIVGLLLHVLCAVFLCLLFYRLTKSNFIAGAAGLIFAVHPIHVERVAGVTASYDLLGDGLLLIALFMYAARFRDDRPPWRNFLYLSPLSLSVFSSEMGASFLPLIVAIDFVTAERFRDLFTWRYWKHYLAAAAVVGFYFTVRLSVLGTLDRAVARPAEGFLYNLLTVMTTWLSYLKLFVLHWQMVYFHHLPVAGPGRDAVGWMSLAIMAQLALVAVLGRKKWPWASLGILWFFAALLPFSQILPNSPAFQERYAYLPLAGYALIVAAIADTPARILKTRKTRLTAALVGAAYLAMLASYTAVYTKAFADDFTLWSRTARVAPRHAGAQNNLGTAYMQRGDCAAAIPFLDRAAELDPRFEIPLRNLGRCYEHINRPKDAFAAYGRYLKLIPQDEQTRLRRALIGIANGRSPEVIAELEPLIAKGVSEPRLLLALAMAYREEDRIAAAREALMQYLSLQPQDRQASDILANLPPEPKTP
ncbi:MAG TPA: hypothetical protein PK961_00800 [bacterium]|nr:hypothetical protein [bacterium]